MDNAISSRVADTLRVVFAKLLEAVSCPQRCKDCIGRLVQRKPDDGRQTPAGNMVDLSYNNNNSHHNGVQHQNVQRKSELTEDRYLLTGAVLIGSSSTASSRAMHDVVETVFSKVISKMREDSSSSGGESDTEADIDTEIDIGSASTRFTHLPNTNTATMQSPLSPTGNTSDSNESNDSVFDDSLAGPQIIRPVFTRK